MKFLAMYFFKFLLLYAVPGVSFLSFPQNAANVFRMSSERNKTMDDGNITAIILAGGVGSRMKSNVPKQFLELRGKTVLNRSIDLFRTIKGISKLIVVIDKQYRDQLSDIRMEDSRIVFADPGSERQDSVYNGLQMVDEASDVVCIHDAARPLVTPECIYQVIQDALQYGAAVLGVPMKCTVKESDDGKFVLRTIDRSRLWDIQTPQVIKLNLLHQGFDKVKQERLAVTDDVSIIELLGQPVRLTMGEYTNIKLTTPDDLVVAEQILQNREKM